MSCVGPAVDFSKFDSKFAVRKKKVKFDRNLPWPPKNHRNSIEISRDSVRDDQKPPGAEPQAPTDVPRARAVSTHIIPTGESSTAQRRAITKSDGLLATRATSCYIDSARATAIVGSPFPEHAAAPASRCSHGSTNLASIVVEHESGLNHVGERSHLEVAKHQFQHGEDPLCCS